MAWSALCSPEGFRDALRKGMGRAVKHVRAAPPELVREPLLDACVRWVGYDMMCEGSRVPWLYEMIMLTGEEDWYCAEALKALEQVRDFPEDSRDLYQLTELLAVFALNGHPEARKPLADKLLGFEPTDGFIFQNELPAEIFAVDGIVKILRRYSRMEDRDQAVFSCDYFLAEAEKRLRQPLAEAIKRAEGGDETLHSFLRDLEKYRLDEEEADRQRLISPPVPPQRVPPQPSLDELLSLLDNSPPAPDREWTDETFREENFSLFNQVRRAACTPNRRHVASAESLEKAFEQLLKENDPARQFCLIGAFDLMPMPRFDPSILALMDSPFQVVRWATARALSNTSAPEIRAKGRELLASASRGEDWDHGFGLLTASGRAEDVPLILDALSAIPVRALDAFDIHNIVWSARDLAEKIATPKDAAPIMLWTYENSPCANCREKAFFWLAENRLAPDRLIEECLDDCDEYASGLALEALK